MRCSSNWFCLSVILVFKVVVCQNFGRSYGSGNGRNSSAPVFEMSTECETPNHDLGICVDIRKCPILLNQLANPKTWPFLRASRCETKAAPNVVYVCCGAHNNFTKRTMEEASVFPKSCGRQQPQSDGNRITGGMDRIFGGREALIGEFPWMALLIHRNQFKDTVIGCSGFLIHHRYVLTAAHCTHGNVIKQKGPIISVLLGGHNIQAVKNTQNIRTHKIITHPEYNPRNTGQYNDIAIIHLRRKVRFTEYVQPICLTENHSQSPEKYFLSGWGKTENGMCEDSYSKIKMVVEVPPFDKLKCNEKFSIGNIRLTETQICAGGEEMKDSCAGDSGGPLMRVNEDETWFASGIVSFGMGCGMKDWPAVYTNIAKFMPWIKSQVKE